MKSVTDAEPPSNYLIKKKSNIQRSFLFDGRNKQGYLHFTVNKRLIETSTKEKHTMTISSTNETHRCNHCSTKNALSNRTCEGCHTELDLSGIDRKALKAAITGTATVLAKQSKKLAKARALAQTEREIAATIVIEAYEAAENFLASELGEDWIHSISVENTAAHAVGKVTRNFFEGKTTTETLRTVFYVIVQTELERAQARL